MIRRRQEVTKPAATTLPPTGLILSFSISFPSDLSFFQIQGVQKRPTGLILSAFQSSIPTSCPIFQIFTFKCLQIPLVYNLTQVSQQSSVSHCPHKVTILYLSAAFKLSPTFIFHQLFTPSSSLIASLLNCTSQFQNSSFRFW